MGSNKELSARFTDLFSTGDTEAAREILHPDVSVHGATAEDIQGRDQAIGFITAYRSAFPDAKSVVEDQIEEGDKVVTRWTARGTHKGDLNGIAPTGKPYVISGVTIERIADGRIVEVWVNKDDLGMLKQIGAIG